MKNWLSILLIFVFLLAMIGGVWYIVGEIAELFTGLYAEISVLETDLERTTSLLSQMQDANEATSTDISRLSDLVDEQDRMLQSMSLQLSQ